MPETLSPRDKIEMIHHAREALELAQKISDRALQGLAQRPDPKNGAIATNQEAAVGAEAAETTGEEVILERLERVRHDLHMTLDGVVSVPFLLLSPLITEKMDPPKKTLPRDEDVTAAMGILQPHFKVAEGSKAETRMSNIAHFHAGYATAIRLRLERLAAIEQSLTDELTGVKRKEQPTTEQAEPDADSAPDDQHAAPKPSAAREPSRPAGAKQEAAPGKAPTSARRKQTEKPPASKSPDLTGLEEISPADSGAIPFVVPLADGESETEPPGAVSLAEMDLTSADVLGKTGRKGKIQ